MLRSEVVKEVVQFYGDDFKHKYHLQAQLIQLYAGSGQCSVIEYLQSLLTTERDYWTSEADFGDASYQLRASVLSTGLKLGWDQQQVKCDLTGPWFLTNYQC